MKWQALGKLVLPRLVESQQKSAGCSRETGANLTCKKGKVTSEPEWARKSEPLMSRKMRFGMKWVNPREEEEGQSKCIK